MQAWRSCFITTSVLKSFKGGTAANRAQQLTFAPEPSSWLTSQCSFESKCCLFIYRIKFSSVQILSVLSLTESAFQPALHMGLMCTQALFCNQLKVTVIIHIALCKKCQVVQCVLSQIYIIFQISFHIIMATEINFFFLRLVFSKI